MVQENPSWFYYQDGFIPNQMLLPKTFHLQRDRKYSLSVNGICNIMALLLYYNNNATKWQF